MVTITTLKMITITMILRMVINDDDNDDDDDDDDDDLNDNIHLANLSLGW